MTMVHLNTKAISRKVGQSAVACAAYRAGDVLDDAKYGKRHDYSKKGGVMSADIVLPFALKALGVNIDREALWNLAEAAETRSDSRVAREWLVNLPYELDEDERHALALDFAQRLCDDMDVIADVCIHEPVMKLPFDANAKPSSKRLREGELNPDPRSYHAHILVTTRAPQVGADKTVWFNPKLKIPFEWSNKKRLANELPSSMQEIKRVRALWVDTANRVLAKKNLPLMDARSYKDQGLDQQPTIKMGVEATAMERRGITTEKGNTNRAIKVRNQVQQTLNEQRVENDKRFRAISDGLAWAAEHNESLSGFVGDTAQRIDDSERCLSIAEQELREAEPEIDWSFEDGARATNRTHQAKRRIEAANDGAATAGRYAERPSRLIRETAQRITDTEPDLEWTAQRCENLPKRGDDSKQWVTKDSKRAQDSESIAEEINRSITNRAKPAPSPFDDDYQRAFYERKRRANREADQADSDTQRNKYSDERSSESTRALKRHLAHKLYARHNEKWRLRKGYSESPTDYPDKFDYRQIDLLDTFAQLVHVPVIKDESYHDNVNRIADRFTFDVVAQNRKIIQILQHPKAERAEYDKITADFHIFITKLDAARLVKNKELQHPLGTSETSRMTAATITATSYISHLDKYINNEQTAEDCKVLATERLKETFIRTSVQYKLAYQDLKNLRSNESIQKHVQALEKSLNDFTTKYSERLSEDNLKDIKEGLKILEQKIDIENNYSPSYGFR